MRVSTKEANAAHAEANAVYERFIASGGEVITELKGKKSKPIFVAPKPHSAPVLVGLNTLERIQLVIKKYSPIDTHGIEQHANVSRTQVFAVTKILEADKLIIRKSGKHDETTVFKWTGGDKSFESMQVPRKTINKIRKYDDSIAPISKKTREKIINALIGQGEVDAKLLSKLSGLHINTVNRAGIILTNEGIVSTKEEALNTGIVKFCYSLA